MEHMQAHALSYFPEWGNRKILIQPIGNKAHRNSKIYRYSISAGNEHKVVIAKVTASGNGQNSIETYDENRPRIAPLPDPDLKLLWQYEALAAIHQNIGSLQDSRFGTVRVLDFIADQQTIIMEEVEALTLRQLILKASRLKLLPTSFDFDSTFQNAGAWLVAYHGSTRPNDTVILQSNREDFIRTVHKFVDFLSERIGRKDYFKGVAALTEGHARDTLPVRLPLGLRHGDYALRNILIGPNHRVTGIDTLSRWQSAIYEDIAYFFISLLTVKMQVLTGGLAFSSEKLEGYTNKFLKGYFGPGPVPRKEIRLFEILVLLEKWCSKTAYLDSKLAGKSIFIKTPVFKFMNGFFRRTIDELFTGIDSLPTSE
jgi:hypothetical protein